MALAIAKIKHLPHELAAPSSRLEIALLGRGERGEQATIRFEVDERRAVEAVQASDAERRALALDERDERRPDRVRADRRAERKRAPGRAVVGRTLANEVAARLVQPIENLDPLERVDAVQRCDPRLVNFDPADRPRRPAPGGDSRAATSTACGSRR